MQLVAVIANKSQIQNIVVKSGSFRREFTEKELPTHVDYRVSVENAFDKEKKTISVQISFIALAKYTPSDEDEKAPITIAADFVLSYVLDSIEGVQTEHVDAFAGINGVYNAWPYWREYVQSTSVRLGLPALTLPLMTGNALQKLYEQQSPEDDAKAEEQ